MIIWNDISWSTNKSIESSGLMCFKTNQSDQTLFLLRVFDVGIPTITSFLALIIIAKYSLSETRMLEIRDLLEKRRGKL